MQRNFSPARCSNIPPSPGETPTFSAGQRLPPASAAPVPGLILLSNSAGPNGRARSAPVDGVGGSAAEGGTKATKAPQKRDRRAAADSPGEVWRKSGAKVAAGRPSKRRQVSKNAVLPAGFRLFKCLINGFKQSCHLIVKENCTLTQIRTSLFECQRDHPQAIPEKDLARAVVLKAKPTTMKTNCSITEDDVIHDSDEVTIDSLVGVETVHLYLLCPGAPLPKEFPGVHRRLAKRDTQVCEAHSKQERRAMQRNAKQMQAMKGTVKGTPALPMQDQFSQVATQSASVATLPLQTAPGGSTHGALGGQPMSALPYIPCIAFPQNLGQPNVTAHLQPDMPGSSAVFANYNEVTPPQNVDTQFAAARTSGMWSAPAGAAANSPAQYPDSKVVTQAKYCSVDGCQNTPVLHSSGICMHIPSGVPCFAAISSKTSGSPASAICPGCVADFSAMQICKSILAAMSDCPKQQCHEQHLDVNTTPREGPLRFGRLAAQSGAQKICFCKCVENVLNMEVDPATNEKALGYLAAGMWPVWEPSPPPTTLCRGAQSVHLEFPPRPNRLGIQVEVVLLNNLCSLEIALQDFGEHFDDQLHVVPGNPAETTKFMLEGLMPEHRYGVRFLETVGATHKGSHLGGRMRKLLSVASMPVEIKTLPLVAAHRPSTQINMDQRFGPGSGGGSAGGGCGGGGGGGYYGSPMLSVSSGNGNAGMRGGYSLPGMDGMMFGNGANGVNGGTGGSARRMTHRRTTCQTYQACSPGPRNHGMAMLAQAASNRSPTVIKREQGTKNMLGTKNKAGLTPTSNNSVPPARMTQPKLTPNPRATRSEAEAVAPEVKVVSSASDDAIVDAIDDAGKAAHLDNSIVHGLQRCEAWPGDLGGVDGSADRSKTSCCASRDGSGECVTPGCVCGANCKCGDNCACAGCPADHNDESEHADATPIPATDGPAGLCKGNVTADKPTSSSANSCKTTAGGGCSCGADCQCGSNCVCAAGSA